jgi:uncharacterized protein
MNPDIPLLRFYIRFSGEPLPLFTTFHHLNVLKKDALKKYPPILYFKFIVSHENERKSMKRGRRLEYVIDGYNLIHCLFPGKNKPSLETMRRRTENRLLLFQRNTGNTITLVYDGKDRFREHCSGIALHIVFTSAAKSADLWIVDYVKSLNTKIKLVTIVSSDNELRTYAAAFGARCMKSEEFADLLDGNPVKSGGKNSSLCEKTRAAMEKSTLSGELCDMEIDRWKKLFLSEKP